jgi:hypothetical protein
MDLEALREVAAHRHVEPSFSIIFSIIASISKEFYISGGVRTRNTDALRGTI